MTDKDKLDAIRAEIHRLIDVRGYDREMANDLFAFMDSLPNELVSEELENNAIQYAGKHAPYDDAMDEVEEAFKAGAQWQEKQDQSIIELAEDHAMLAGMEKMKEQMMAKAIDALVHTFDNGYIRVGTQLLENNKYGLKVGDKVKVIIIKDE